MPSFDLSAITALVNDTGVMVNADNYKRAELWFDSIVETVDVASTSAPYLGDRSTTVLVGADPLERQDGSEFEGSKLGQGYTPQGSIKLYGREFSIPMRQVRAAGANLKNAFGSTIEQWQKGFVEKMKAQKNRDIAKAIVYGGKTAGDKKVYRHGWDGVADPHPGLGYDGVCWGSAAHPLALESGTTLSNTLGASGVTFDATNFDAAQVRMTVTNAKDEDNKQIEIQAKKLLHPRALRGTVYQVTNAQLLAGTANNDANFAAAAATGIQAVESSYLDSFSTTFWALLSDIPTIRVMDSGAPLFIVYEDQKTDSVVVRGDYSWGFYLRDFRGIVGANWATS